MAPRSSSLSSLSFALWALFAAAGPPVACTGAPAGTGPTPTPSTPGTVGGGLDVTYGECKSDYRSALDTGGPEVTVAVAVDAGGHFVVDLYDLDANCCPTPGGAFSVDAQDPQLVQLDFQTETGTESCDCMCVFDFEVTSVASYAAGAYTVRVSADGADLGAFPVEVP